MNRWIIALSLGMLITMITACRSENAPLPDAPNPYSIEQAISNGDVVQSILGVENLKRWESFKQNVSKQQKDQVRITSFGIDGGPYVYELTYDGNIIHYFSDTSRDYYSDNVTVQMTCTGIHNTVHPRLGSIDQLTGCEQETGFALVLDTSMTQDSNP